MGGGGGETVSTAMESYPRCVLRQQGGGQHRIGFGGRGELFLLLFEFSSLGGGMKKKGTQLHSYHMTWVTCSRTRCM